MRTRRVLSRPIAVARARAWAVGAILFSAAGAWAQGGGETPPAAERRPVFDVLFDVGIVASEKSAHVAIRLGSNAGPVEWLRFDFDPLRHRAIEADGELVEVDGGLEWRPPENGGSLRYVFSIDHLRDDKSYDSRCAKTWAVFRGEDLVPKIRIRTDPIARSRSRMQLRLPEGWSAAIPYARRRGGRYAIDDPRTRFDRPAGWFAFGKLGVVRETIADSRIAVAGPEGQGVRRMDLLALLKWTLPSVAEVFGELPERLQVVVAGDPMWRGGLSGPNSLYLHVDRPLIGEDGSSPILHELVHSLMHARAGKDGDWVVEGLAELYSISLLRRSETVTAARYESTLENVRERAVRAGNLRASAVDGDTRAKAVLILMEFDAGIREATAGARNLDSVVRSLAEQDKTITTARFRQTVAEVAGRDLAEIFDRYGLDGA